MREVVLPHLVASQACWALGDWHHTADPDEKPLSDRLPDWDYSTPLDLSSNVDVDVAEIRRMCGLGPSAPIALVALWHSTSTGIREAAVVDLPIEGPAPVTLRLQLDGPRLGGRLRIDRQIILRHSSPGDDPCAASAAGSILLTEPRDRAAEVLLEGEAARFPTEVTSFAGLPFAEPEALWALRASLADLDAAAMSAIRLYVNGDHQAVARALDASDDAGALVRSVMLWDVARSLIEAAIDSDEFVEGWGSYEEESVGDVLQGLIQRYWPGESGASLRARREADRHRFAYQLQARFALMGSAQ